MTHAWRLTFAYEGEKFTLKSAHRLVKRVPPGQSPKTGQAGRFIELRGANRQILYRRSITELLSDTVEYPTGDPARPLGRAVVRRGEIALLVPALAEGRAVAIVSVGARITAGSKAKGMVEEPAERDLVAVDLPLADSAQQGEAL